jgi:hypothetical protein
VRIGVLAPLSDSGLPRLNNEFEVGLDVIQRFGTGRPERRAALRACCA